MPNNSRENRSNRQKSIEKTRQYRTQNKKRKTGKRATAKKVDDSTKMYKPVENKKTKKVKKEKKHPKLRMAIKIMLVIFLLLCVIGISLLVIMLILYFFWNGKKYVGTWEHYINWHRNGNVVRQSYAMYDLKKNKTFTFIGYTLDENTDRVELSGTYSFNKEDNIIYLTYVQNQQEYITKLYFYNEKVCYDDQGINCFYKEGNNVLDMKES